MRLLPGFYWGLCCLYFYFSVMAFLFSELYVLLKIVFVLCLVYSVLPVYIHCPFLIHPSVFSSFVRDAITIVQKYRILHSKFMIIAYDISFNVSILKICYSISIIILGLVIQNDMKGNDEWLFLMYYLMGNKTRRFRKIIPSELRIPGGNTINSFISFK
jgi:hypothetical protein